MPDFETVKYRRVSDDVSDQIRRLLAEGGLKAGDKLPPERELAQRLGVGRNALREALRGLEKSGVLNLQRGGKGGAFIGGGDPAALSQGLSDLLSLRAVTITQLNEARALIAQGVTQAACAAATEEDFAALDAELVEAQAAFDRDDLKAKFDHLLAFHNRLADATRNPVLAIVMHSLMALTATYARGGAGLPDDASMVELRRFMVHLRRRRVAAASREMTAHLHSAAERYVSVAKKKR